jgi:hypothetical protein
VRPTVLTALVLGLAAGCSPAPPEPPDAVLSEEARPGAAGEEETRALQRQARPRESETVCQLLARRAAEFALAADGDAEAFLTLLQEEVVSGADDPFDLKDGLHQGEWNEAYIYAGHGGFRPQFDDAQRYPRGGNHQPGHFVSVLTIAHRFGVEHARVAIGHVGDLEPEQEDDLRLSLRAIQLGSSLGESMTPGEVALAVSELCR